MNAQTGESVVRGLICKEVIVDYLTDYLDRNLSPRHVADFERHLEACAPCRAYLNTYRQTRRLVAEVTRPAMPDEMRAIIHRYLLTQLADGRM